MDINDNVTIGGNLTVTGGDITLANGSTIDSSANAGILLLTEDVVKSFCVLGSPQHHINKLNELKASGVTQFNIYLDSGDEEKVIADYGEKIIPAFTK